jgi:hypothetical protein
VTRKKIMKGEIKPLAIDFIPAKSNIYARKYPQDKLAMIKAYVMGFVFVNPGSEMVLAS